jgi:heat-inducible transcriptional repressor
MEANDLTPRQQAILLAVVGEYIVTAEPVPSKVVQEKHGLPASRATIRNEMAEMERLGYLGKPHTSAGRVPTEAAYRLYVSQLQSAAPGLSREHTWVRGELARAGSDLAVLLRTSTRVLADLTEQAALASEPVAPGQCFLAFRLAPVSARAIRVRYETEEGRRELLWEPEQPLRSDQINALGEVLASALAREGLDRLDAEVLAEETGLPREVLAGLLQLLAENAEQRVYVEGAAHLFACPDFQERSRMQELLNTLSGEGPARALLRGVSRREGISVMIGSELSGRRFHDCGLVAQTYRGARACRGAVAVLGPLRMPYPRAMAAVQCVAQEIGGILGKGEEEADSR